MHNISLWYVVFSELILFNGHNQCLTVNMKGSTRGSVSVIIQCVGREVEPVWVCASCARDWYQSPFTKDINNNNNNLHVIEVDSGDELRRLPGVCVCARICLCLCCDCGERCDLIDEWCAAWCEDWEPINTLPFFYSTHLRHTHCCVCLPGIQTREWLLVSGCMRWRNTIWQSIPAFFKLLFV